jgi:hypothetical protein
MRPSKLTINTKRIRLTRSILLGGEHAQEGSVHEVAKQTADDLIVAGSAVPLRSVWQVAVAVCCAIGVGALVWCTRLAGWW